MYIYKAKRQHMSQDGKAILRSIQNENMPRIDLVIREAFQNSLDATSKEEKETEINVIVEKFQTRDVAGEFQGLEKKLIERFPEEQTVLAIQDKKTYGLRGVTHLIDDEETLWKSDFYKLVYGLSMNKEGNDKGGSWGLGKTSYFRLGIGLVLYYTQVKIDSDEYEERLAASLIEDPNSSNRLIDSPLGLVWWGETKNHSAEFSDTKPIIDSQQIHNILDKFNVPKYGSKETGTTIIIPFVDTSIFESSDYGQDDDSPETYWQSSIEEAIHIAIQRWYNPRIGNPGYREITGNSMLSVCVNGSPFNKLEFETIFKVFSDLYIAALSGKSDMPSIKTEDVILPRTAMKTSKDPVGRVAFIELEDEEFQSGYRPSTYVGLNIVDGTDQKSSAILAYCRKPGMVIEYVTQDSAWFKDVSLKEGTHLLAFFVPKSTGELSSWYKENTIQQYTQLESYLRDSETADHAKWMDKTDGKKKLSLIERIQNYTAKEIRKDLSEGSEKNMGRFSSVLQRQMGARFLPVDNFGKSATKQPKPNEGSKRNVSKRNRLCDIDIVKTDFISEDRIKVFFRLFLYKKGTSIIRVDATSTERNIGENEWYDLMANYQYPFEVGNLDIETVNKKSVTLESFLSLSVKKHPNGVKSWIELCYEDEKSIEVEGSFILKIKDETIQPILTIRGKAVEKEGKHE